MKTPIIRVKTTQGKIIRYAKVSVPNYTVPTVHSDYNGPMRSRNIRLRQLIDVINTSKIELLLLQRLEQNKQLYNKYF